MADRKSIAGLSLRLYLKISLFVIRVLSECRLTFVFHYNFMLKSLSKHAHFKLIHIFTLANIRFRPYQIQLTTAANKHIAHTYIHMYLLL